MNENKIFSYLIRILLIIFAIVQLYPLLWMITFSLKSNQEIFGGNVIGLPHKFLWQNYVTAYVNAKVNIYFKNSVIVTVSTILLSGLLATMAAYGITRMKWRLSGSTLNLFLMGLMVPIHATLLPLFLVLRSTGLLNSYWSLIIPYIAFALPMAIYIMSSYFRSIPRELEESACIDGANIYQIFFRIILPLVRTAIVTISIFTFLSAWNELMFAVIFINKPLLRTLTVGIMSMFGQYNTEWGPVGAALVIATVPTLITYVFLSSRVQQSITAAAIKG